MDTNAIHRMPAMILVGETNTFKSWFAQLCVAFFGERAAELCGFHTISVPIAIDRFSKMSFPIICHDLDDPALVTSLIEATFERHKFANFNSKKTDGVMPSSAAMFAMNKDKLRKIVNQPHEVA
jgi:hypothetical protein